MVRDHTVTVVGAGVIGAAVAYALTREGRAVLLLDRAEPGMTGASFGNAGHIAAELVEPLPSWDLLFGFWRELFAFGGALDIPLRRAPAFLPWALRFAAAARHRTENTRQLAPLVKPAVSHMARWLAEVGRPELLRTNGHFQVWFGPRSDERAAEQGLAMERLGIPTQAAPNEILQVIARQSSRSLEPTTSLRHRNAHVAGLWFTSTGHVLDPLKIVQRFRRCRTSARRVFQVRRGPHHQAARGADRPTYERRDPDRRRGRRVYGGLDRELAGAARLARADGKRTRVSRGDGRSSSAHRRANPLCRLAHLAHSDGRTTTRYQLHGVCRTPRRTRPAKIGAIAYTPWGPGLRLPCRWPELGWITTGASRLSSGHRSSRTHLYLLCGRAPTHWLDAGAGDRGADFRSDGQPSAQTRCLRLRSAAILRFLHPCPCQIEECQRAKSPRPDVLPKRWKR